MASLADRSELEFRACESDENLAQTFVMRAIVETALYSLPLCLGGEGMADLFIHDHGPLGVLSVPIIPKQHLQRAFSVNQIRCESPSKS